MGGRTRDASAAAALSVWIAGMLWAAPAAADEPGAQEVDAITSVGEALRPPRREASIVLPAGRRVSWDPRWRKFDWLDAVVTGSGVAAAIGGVVVPPSPERWVKDNAFDRATRARLRLGNLADRNRMRDASDILLTVSINQLLIDTVLVTWWGHDNGEVALQMGMMNVEAIAINAGINGLVAAIASRQRPYAADDPRSRAESVCVGADDDDLRDCRSRRRFRSFFSGHTSTTFAVAGLTCMHHSQLPLYGGGWPDAAVCVGGFAVATATGTLRVVADQHWATDVLMGAAMGTFNGMFWPWLLHYRTGDLPDAGRDQDAVRWLLMPTPQGAELVGTF